MHAIKPVQYAYSSEVFDANLTEAIQMFYMELSTKKYNAPNNVKRLYQFAFYNCFFTGSIPVIVCPNIDVVCIFLEKINACFVEHMKNFKQCVIAQYCLQFTTKIDWTKASMSSQVLLIDQSNGVDIRLKKQKRYAFSNKRFVVEQFKKSRIQRKRSLSESVQTTHEMIETLELSVKSPTGYIESIQLIEGLQNDIDDAKHADLDINAIISEFKRLNDIY